MELEEATVDQGVGQVEFCTALLLTRKENSLSFFKILRMQEVTQSFMAWSSAQPSIWHRKRIF
eukprot:1150796-Pelagomonas_calceolata.AAC.15